MAQISTNQEMDSRGAEIIYLDKYLNMVPGQEQAEVEDSLLEDKIASRSTAKVIEMPRHGCKFGSDIVSDNHPLDISPDSASYAVYEKFLELVADTVEGAQLVRDAQALYHDNPVEGIAYMSNVIINLHEHAIERYVSETTIDTLTNAKNKKYFNDTLAREIKRARRYGEDICLVFFDLDNFKAANDSYGHQVCDRFLCDLVDKVLPDIRAADTLARWGGDEFAIVLPSTDNYGGVKVASGVCMRVRELSDSYKNDAPEDQVDITASVGVVCLSDISDRSGYEDLLKAADGAMYEAKKQGKGKILSYKTQKLS